jgi:carbonic anhydrase
MAAPRDPLDVIRDRLAQKLGAVKPADAPNPNVLRVVAKSQAPNANAANARVALPQAAPRHATPARAADAGSDASGLHVAEWSYDGTAGPQSWGRIKPEFAKCASGTRQSPIDIRDGLKLELDAVRFDYQPRAFRVVDNGHTVQVNLAAGNAIEVLGRRYELVEFHFHRPSEERIDGRQFDMVAHLVHKDLEGRLAVVAVLLERGPALGIVQNVWNNLPLEKGEEVVARTPLDLNELLPSQRSYFTYMGSLTTPPCSEGVLWMVMKQPVGVSTEQLAVFARLYPMNARPIQSASGRLIKESN